MINYILQNYKFNRDLDEAWMVGDNSKDMLSAKNANISSLFATWGFSPNGKHEQVLKIPKEILDIVL
jgi:phosphoglycolate phosphatase